MKPTAITRTARPVFRGREMRVLRLLSLAAGVFAILLPAALLASAAHGIPDWLEPYIVLVGVALGSGGFFLVAMAGHRMGRDALLRSLAALLLVVPFGASGIVIWHGSNMLMVYLCTFFLMLTIMLYFSFIAPLMHVPQPKKTRSRRTPRPLQWPVLRRPGAPGISNAPDATSAPDLHSAPELYSQPASRASR